MDAGRWPFNILFCGILFLTGCVETDPLREPTPAVKPLPLSIVKAKFPIDVALPADEKCVQRHFEEEFDAFYLDADKEHSRLLESSREFATIQYASNKTNLAIYSDLDAIRAATFLKGDILLIGKNNIAVEYQGQAYSNLCCDILVNLPLLFIPIATESTLIPHRKYRISATLEYQLVDGRTLRRFAADKVSTERCVLLEYGKEEDARFRARQYAQAIRGTIHNQMLDLIADIKENLNREAARTKGKDLGRVAVMPFMARTPEVKVKAGALTEVVSFNLTDDGRFHVLERNQLDKIIQEKKFSQSSLADPDSQVEIGKMLSADYVLVGSVGNEGKNLSLDCCVLEVKTGRALSGECCSCLAGDEIDARIQVAGLVDKMLDKIEKQSGK